MTAPTQRSLILGAIGAAAAAVVGYLLLNGIIDATLASGLSVAIAAVAGASK